MYFLLLCGIPGCGKSSLSERLTGYVVTTDGIRKFLWGQESIVEHDRLVFNIARQIVEYKLHLGDSVILEKVPEFIIRALNNSFQKPELEEGIDIIRVFDRDLQTTKIITPRLTLKRGKINLSQK